MINLVDEIFLSDHMIHSSLSDQPNLKGALSSRVIANRTVTTHVDRVFRDNSFFYFNLCGAGTLPGCLFQSVYELIGYRCP